MSRNNFKRMELYVDVWVDDYERVTGPFDGEEGTIEEVIWFLT